MTGPKTYRKNPEQVEAISFSSWGDAISIWKWTGGCVFYVPEGAEHNLRKQSEYDRSTGVIADGYQAPAFLVVSTNAGDQRADHGDYIVRDSDGNIFVLRSYLIRQDYEEVIQ